ncbi:MAG: flagellar motor switch protein FliG [Hyphomicrobium zavarzinii]|uniref:flagellar motor switch protein FliG n=1 Tax=Hyphomicrobium TaxID=81 RepID=UPI0012EB4037|nr:MULTISPECIES: FliG C-terminal domain-containing protein [Hyphomicrobium]MBL8845734.1 flagellar motor switch protein FliG [Hyphomicrobium zavarzinii]WBT39551.1 flagellar motor switch protein FliG [Hyphomicrobium sp. DMF-1]
MRQPDEDQSLQQMPGTSKAAAILLALNKELAGRVLKFFDEEEVKIVAQAVNDLGSVSRQTLDKLIEDFASDIKSGVDFGSNTRKIQALLEGVLSPEQIEALLAQTGTRSTNAVWQQLAKMPDAAVGQYLMKEHPQIIALVLSRAEPQTSANLLTLLPKPLANDVVGRMLSLRPVLERPMVLLEISFVQDVLLNRRRDSDLSPHTRLAEVINKMDRKLMDDCLAAIGAYNEKDADLIRQQLFTFDDLDRLTELSLVTVFDSIQPDVIIKALFGIPKPLLSKILEAIPGRARRAIEAELEGGATPKPKEVHKAQRAIADVALQLLERGAIEMQSDDGEQQQEELI